MTDLDSFFDRFPRLLETSQTRRLPNRLFARHRVLFEGVGVDFRDKRVLDLGSHDGRWSLAALDAGAVSVTGIEGRTDMVEAARETFAVYGITPSKADFIVGDVLQALMTLADTRFDIVLNLGFFYHTIQHAEILDKLSAPTPAVIVTDTAITRLPGLALELRVEETADPRMSIDYGVARRGRVITGRPSRDALVTMMDLNGYDTRFHDWSSWVGAWDDLDDYREGTRVTAVSTRRV